MIKALLIAAVLAQTADTVSTCQALRQGYVEGNPLLPSSCAGIVAVKSATTGIAVPLVWRLRERRIAPWLAAALVIAPAVAAVHNWRVSG